MHTKKLITVAAIFAALSAALLASAPPAGAEFFGITPCRIIDTRKQGEGPAILSGDTRYVVAKGICGIPTVATSITYNLTVVQPGAAGYVTLYSSDVGRPIASSVNFKAGETRGNAGVVNIAEGYPDLAAYVKTSSSTATAHIIIDVTGYHAGSAVALAASIKGPNVTPDRWRDNFDGTVSDRLTGLTWEKKTNDGVSLNDKDQTSTYADLSLWILALNGLNGSRPCFAGHCDWRMPTVHELQSLHDNCGLGAPCSAIPGYTKSGHYWSSSEDGPNAWFVDFSSSLVNHVSKFNAMHMRAVRGGR